MDNNNQQPTIGAEQNTTNDSNPSTQMQPPQVVTSPQPVAPQPKETNKKPLLMALLIVISSALVGFGGYALGNSNATSDNAVVNEEETTEQELTLPAGATVIAECAKGRGTQYALPKDIPLGPVYNVHEGEIIGIEYMIGKDELLVESRNFLNLPLNDMKYDHINVGLLSEGHAGFPSPHYHVDVMMVPTSVTDQITCS